jgi:sugar-specific transcriptional regulator TrmB
MNILNEPLIEREIRTLTELGLTISQAKVYLTLTKSRFLDAQTISINSGVARPDVYRMLDQLQRNGFVVTTISEPKYFQAIPLDECLSMLILRKETKIAELKKEAQVLITDCKVDFQEEKDCYKPEFVFIPNKEASFNKTKKQLIEVRDCLCLFGAHKMLNLCLANYQFLRMAIERNVRCRMILDVSEQNPKILKALKDFEGYPTFSLKLLKEPVKTGFGIYDDKELAVGTSERKSVNKYPCLWFTNQQIINLFQDYFEIMWQKAEPYSPQ